MRPTADNSGHTAKHRSAQIAKATSYVHKTLYDIGLLLYNMRVKLKWHLMYN